MHKPQWIGLGIAASIFAVGWWFERDPAGWTCSTYGSCTPHEGRWEQLRVGMSYDRALGAVCFMLKNNVIASSSDARDHWTFGGLPSSPVEFVGTRCLADSSAHSDSYSIWKLQVKSIHCTFGLQRRVVFVQFDKANNVETISMHCPYPDF